MDPDTLIKLVLLAAFVAASGFFAGSETALFSLSPLRLARLREDGNPKAGLLLRLTRRPHALLNSLLIGNETSDVTASVIAASLFIAWFGGRGEFYAILVMIPLSVLVGEVIPKVLAALSPVRFASAIAKPVAVWMALAAPVRWLADRLVKLIPAPPEAEEVIPEGEFMAWVESSHKEGLVQELERDFIQNVIRFEKRTLAAVMTPRTDVFSLNVEMPWDEAVRRVRARHFSRIPVWEGREDDVIGLLHAKDLLRAGDGHGEGASLRGLLRPVTFAPETKRAEAMLWEMQKKRLHMVIVVDEYGGLAGLVTLDDLLEELFGEIYDEHELTARPIREKAPGVWTVSASLEVPEFNERLGERLGAPLPEEEGYETLGGFLLHAFGRMPTQGEELRYDGLRFVPTRLKGTRILEVEVRKP